YVILDRYMLITNANHKYLGLYYLWFSFIFGVYGFLLSLIIRIELYSSSLRIIAQENINYYNMIFTVHGIIMIFFNVMPGLFGGFGNYFLPILCGSTELAYPRINSISLLLQPIAFILVFMSSAAESGGGTGWTLYPPLSTSLMSISPIFIDVIVFGLLISGISSLMTSFNFITTLFNLRIKGYLIGLFYPSIWSFIITSVMLIITLPVLTGGLLMLLSDLHFNTLFFDPTFSGDPVLYQHLFWFFGHPEVYVIVIPIFGMVSHLMCNNYCRVLIGDRSMVLAMFSIAFLGSLVWAHHMYTTSIEADAKCFFSIITISIAIPTGTKLFNWVCTYACNNILPNYNASILILLFIFTFTFGGTTGVMLGNAAFNVALHDTYYVVGHFHYILSIAAIIGLFTVVSGFQENYFGKHIYDNILIILWIMLFLSSTNLIFFPMHFLGFNVMPRRIPDYPDYLNGWNMVCSIGSMMTLFGLYIFKKYLMFLTINTLLI
uniref:cytochrome oxidase subunit 1 n=1 Tax=Haemoproteus nisi TaxID=3104273 RepID=UPI002E760D39